MKRRIFKIIAFIIIITLVVFNTGLLSCKSIEEDLTAELPQKEGATEETAETETKEEAPETIQTGEVTFKTEDGLELNGNVFGQGKKWVILAHMKPTDQRSWFDFAGNLEQEGYVALTFDFRGYGKSKGEKDLTCLDKDIEAAIYFIRQYDYEKLFLVGASMGGTASIVVAAEDSDISGVVSLSSPDMMGDYLDALSVVAELKMPKIFICTGGDRPNAESAERLFEKAVEPKTLKILENSSEHGTYILDNEPENARILKELIIDFLNSN